MKFLTDISVLLLLISLLCLGCGDDEGGIQWIDNFERGKEIAIEKKKPLLVYYRVAKNDYCDKMENEIFYSEDILKYRNKFVWVWIDGEVEIELPKSYGVPAYPTVITYSSKGKELIREVGYVDEDGFEEILKDSLEGRCEYEEILSRVESEPENLENLWSLALAQKDRSLTLELLETLNKIIEIDENNDANYKTKALLERGFQYMIVGNYNRAIEEYEIIVDNFPESEAAPQALDYIGDCYRLLDDEDMAMRTYERVVERYPDSEAGERSENKLGKMKAFKETVKALWE